LKVRWRRIRAQGTAAAAPAPVDRPNSARPNGSGALSEWLSALGVEWAIGGAPTRGAGGTEISEIDASGLRMKVSDELPPFAVEFEAVSEPPAGSYFVDPLILYDLDGDGLSEMVLAAKNLVYHRRADGSYAGEALCRVAPGLIFTGVIADFDSDGVPDFLCARFEGLFLYSGSGGRVFEGAPRMVWAASPRLKYAQVMSCGDIDQDGDLDVWLGQYRVPYQGGQMPTPYYDANDGYPWHLLHNDGGGGFTDRTGAWNLGGKQRRRCYSGSFTDLDGDGDLDLAVVSDFAGLDLFENTGGRFEEVTGDWAAETRAFGMAHSIADFDGDGQLDLLMIGMNSPTAERLNRSGLERAGPAGGVEERRRMVYGNRLLLGGGTKSRFRQGALSETIRRSGWAWGCSSFDWDNDGFVDVAVANGHESRQSVRDFEPEFWLHDIFVGTSTENRVADVYFGSKAARTRGRGVSYGGYEKNRLFWNRDGKAFVEIGYLMGLAMEQDCRNVVADDIDGDGWVDLLVTTFEVWPRVQQTLRVFRNLGRGDNHWIGIRLREEGEGVSPVGARVRVTAAGRTLVREMIVGDSFRSQHANTVHFGLGTGDSVERVEVRWVNGRSSVIPNPPIDRYHSVGSNPVQPTPPR